MFWKNVTQTFRFDVSILENVTQTFRFDGQATSLESDVAGLKNLSYFII